MQRKLRIDELNRLSEMSFKEAPKVPIVVVLDNIRSLNNVGSIFRTSDALRLEKIILCGITATPPHNDIHKTALGAEESMDWQYFEMTEEAISHLKVDNYKIISVEQVDKSTSLLNMSLDPNHKYAFIFGNEVKGVKQAAIDLSDQCIEIPQFGTKHSFNVSVSAGIVLWEAFKQVSPF